MAHNLLGLPAEDNSSSWKGGSNEQELIEEVIPVIYSKLKKMAHFQKFSFQGADTLNTTALVHEAYIKLAHSPLKWENELHFYAIAGKAMRQILLNHSRAKMTAKRGKQAPVVDVHLEGFDLPEHVCQEMLGLEEALQHLEKEHPREAKVVEMRFFAGMTVEETAALLKISPATVKRCWQVAKVWLLSEMNK